MSKELYNSLEEALRSESVFSLLSTCNDIALVVYDSESLSPVEILADFFDQNDLELINIKELVFHGKNRIAIRRKTLDVSSYFIAPHFTYTGLSGAEMYAYSHLKRMLCVHILPNEIKREHMSLIEKNRYMYQIVISNKNDQIQTRVNISLRELSLKKTSAHKRISKYCKDKRTYLQKLIDSNYLEAAFNQCAQECKNGCDECVHAASYGQEKCCPYFQLQMAKFYENGWYVPQNDKIAHFWKLKAARQGMYEAELDLASDYVHGKGCTQNIEKAISVLMSLSDNGYTTATNNLIDIATSYPDYTTPVPLIARLANNGDLNMIERMIDIYSKGDLFVKADPIKCEEWVILAADYGCVQYVEALARQFEDINDWDKAIRWYLKLQELNPALDLSSKIDELFIDRCSLLTDDELLRKGDSCYYGYCCEQDYHSAYLYYKLAAERDNPDGIYGLAKCYSLGRGVEIDEVKGLELYELSAAKGSAVGILRKIKKSDIFEDTHSWIEPLREAFEKGEKKNDPNVLRLIALDYMGGCLVNELDEEKGIEYLNKAIENGDYASIRELGKCYCEGIGVNINYPLAYKYFQDAIVKGVASAYHCLGCMYRKGNKGIDKDLHESYKHYLKAAEKGYLPSQIVVAKMLRDGICVEQNDTEMVKWFEQAAIQGDNTSQTYIGELYFWGIKVPKDYEKSRYWIRKAALSGYTKAYFRYAYLCCDGLGGEVDYDSALKYYRLLSDNSGAINNLGYMYEYGLGVDKDIVRAFELYKEAAEMGDAHSMRVLAGKYYSGEGCEKDITTAITWYKKSLENGNMEAGFKLGDIFLNEANFEVDSEVALEYYEKAIALKPKPNSRLEDTYVKQVLKVAKLYYDGDKVEMNDERANELFHIVAEYGEAEAYHMLGLQYYNGYGVDEDEEVGIYWFRKAASEGYSASIRFLDEHNIDWISNNDDPDLPF